MHLKFEIDQVKLKSGSSRFRCGRVYLIKCRKIIACLVQVYEQTGTQLSCIFFRLLSSLFLQLFFLLFTDIFFQTHKLFLLLIPVGFSFDEKKKKIKRKFLVSVCFLQCKKLFLLFLSFMCS